MRLRIDLAYDGGPFAGFARQVDQRTVQGDLESALARLFGQAVRTTCAGRTDRGVHALAQVVHLDVDPTAPRVSAALGDVSVLRRRLDALLGEAVTVWQVRRVGDAFDARFSATARAYRFRLVDDARAADPRRRHEHWRLDAPLDVGAMRAASRCLIGEHDFAAFCRRAPGRTTVRRVDRLTVARPAPGRVDVRLRGPAFCHQQVRSVVGCLVDIGQGRRPVAWLAEVLASRDRATAGRVAPPHGLTLEAVSYGRRWPTAPPAAVRRALAGSATS